jgi:uncharacterized membrane protein
VSIITPGQQFKLLLDICSNTNGKSLWLNTWMHVKLGFILYYIYTYKMHQQIYKSIAKEQRRRKAIASS